MNYPFKKIYVTQKWGVNPDIYARFGFKGHNGVDLRLFDENGNKATTSLIYAPHDGTVKERSFDADGYGYYLKIESETEGSILAHLKEFRVNINKQVKEGDLIGIADNTGWSTGSHLHWGYYRKPRDRSNGYGGTIDPTPYIKPSNTMTENLQPLLDKYGVKDLAELDKKINDHVGTDWGGGRDSGYLGGEREKNKNLLIQIKGLEESLERTKADGVEAYAQSELRKKELQNFIESLAKRLTLPASSDQTDILAGVDRLIEVEEQLRVANKKITQEEKKHEIEKSEMQKEIDSLKAEIAQEKIERDATEKKLLGRIESLENRLTGNESAVDATNAFKTFIEKLLSIFSKEK